jgi:DNA-binding HxlR family transcriptional regulator
MPHMTDSLENCPVRGIIDKIGDKWSVLILLHLHHGDMRFTVLKRTIPDISQRVLTSTLRKLEREGLVWRMVDPTIPPRVTYGNTGLGRSLVTHLGRIAEWAKESRAEIDQSRAAFDARNQ